MTASILVSATISQRSYDNVQRVFESLFKSLLQSWQESIEENEESIDRMHTDELVVSQRTIVQLLQTLGWLHSESVLSCSKKEASFKGLPFVQQALYTAIQKTIQSKIQHTIHGQFDVDSHYASISDWNQQVLCSWIQTVLSLSEVDSNCLWNESLQQMIAQSYARVRMEELFDMVAEYPDSQPAVLELQTVLQQQPTQQLYNELAKTLRTQLEKRLNHPGANTLQIIDVYISTIKVLQLLDPSQRLLSVVTEPVRGYLQQRPDTIRCIIASLTDAELGGDLYQELRRQDVKPLENVTVDSDDEEECPDFSWEPPPSIFQQRASLLESSVGNNKGRGGGDSDILAMLVSIYGSKELFVNEYRLMLADKLLVNLNYDTDNDVHTLELLKLRFGEMSMRNCEVMLKDLDDSKRTNTLIATNMEGDDTFQRKAGRSRKCVTDVATISHIFWPPLQSEQVKHHPRMQAELDGYANEFERLKNPRKLFWFDQLGSVDMELDVVETDQDGNEVLETKEFTCSPLLASLISHFEDKPRWTTEELSNESGVPEHVLDKRMAFWVNNRVLHVVPHAQSGPKSVHTTTYEIASVQHLRDKDVGHQKDYASMMMMDDDFGSEGQAVSISAQEEEAMNAYESYIVGMLTNMQQLPLDRIHNMLKMFAAGSDIRYNKTPQQLNQFLQHLVRAEKLECGPDGMYKLFKK